MGKGKFFVTQENYKQQFIKKIGYIPYDGTLNIKIKNEDISNILKKTNGTIIKRFREKKRKFGQVKCLPCTLFKDKKMAEGTVVVPEKSLYTDIIEIIAPCNLRKKLNLTDGDIIEIILNV
jgi:riboflavin kinase